VSTVDDSDGRRADLVRELTPGVPVCRGALSDVREAHALLAIGPLTNVARLVAAGYRPPRLAFMGGALRPVRHRGEVMTIEHNFGGDPGAAASVVGHGRALICPLDVTSRMVLGAQEKERLAAADPRLVPHFRDWDERRGGAPLCLHDPLALLALLGEPLVRIEILTLIVETHGRLVESHGGGQHEVVVDVDVAAAKARILALVDERVGP
jgi:inosine-uridine nucleoside N-ribohydrolase